MTALGSSDTATAIKNTATTLLSIGQAAHTAVTGGALTTTTKIEAAVTSIATNAVNMLVAGQAAVTAVSAAEAPEPTIVGNQEVQQ